MYEEMPAPAPAVVEEVPVAAVYEEVAPGPSPEPSPQQAPPPPEQGPAPPKDIKSAHEELMRKLLKR
jgi:hypothetical protein